MIPAAVMAATDTDPIARCSTAAMSHASRMLRVTGAASSAVKRSARTVSSPVSWMTAPRVPPMPVTSPIAPAVWKPSPIAASVPTESTVRQQPRRHRAADDQRAVPALPGRRDLVTNPERTRRHRMRSSAADQNRRAGRQPWASWCCPYQLRGRRLDHRLVNILCFGRRSVAAAQEQPEAQCRHDRGQTVRARGRTAGRFREGPSSTSARSTRSVPGSRPDIAGKSPELPPAMCGKSSDR